VGHHRFADDLFPKKKYVKWNGIRTLKQQFPAVETQRNDILCLPRFQVFGQKTGAMTYRVILI
jgi:hypothetical protein